jgi:hypothetical protein
MVTVDRNGKDGVEAIPNFLEALQQGSDFPRLPVLIRWCGA